MDAPNPTAGSSEPSKIGYPNSPCNKSGHQTVQEDPLHRTYWEDYGPADGEPVTFLHGGPGAGCQKFFTHFFNPERCRVILFDQRGCDKSTPSASDDDATAALTDNTHFVTEIPPEDRGDVVKGWRRFLPEQPQNKAERERVLKAASACVAWESSASRLKRDESSQSQPNQKYALMAGRILIHYMINGGFLCAGGEANRDNNYILDHVDRLKEIPVHIVHGRYDRVCHLYQAEALVRVLRAVGNNEVNYFNYHGRT